MMAFRNYAKQFVVFASELASAIEQNPYQAREETALKVWKRFDNVSFGFAVALAYVGEVFELAKACMKRENMPPLKHPLPSEVESEEGKQSFVAALREIFTSSQWYKLCRRIIAFADTKEFRDVRENDILKALGESRKVQEAMIALCSEEKKSVDEKVDEVCRKITAETGKEVDKKTQEALTSRLRKDRGTKLEAKTVVEFAASSGKAVRREPAKLYQKVMHYQGLSWELRGRVDARDNETIVEVKNRTKKFMCPDYDVLQLQAYMFLCNKKKGILLERLHGENRETPFKFNESYWHHAVVPALHEFIADVEEKVIASRTLLDQTTSNDPSPLKRKAMSEVTPTTLSKKQNSPADNVEPKTVLGGSSWGNMGSSDIIGDTIIVEGSSWDTMSSDTKGEPKTICEGSSWDNMRSSDITNESKTVLEGSSWDNMGLSDTMIEEYVKRTTEESSWDNTGLSDTKIDAKTVLEGSSWDNMGSSDTTRDPKRVSEGLSWDDMGSSDTEICSSQDNDSFVLYLSLSETESDEELANLPLENFH